MRGRPRKQPKNDLRCAQRNPDLTRGFRAPLVAEIRTTLSM